MHRCLVVFLFSLFFYFSFAATFNFEKTDMENFDSTKPNPPRCGVVDPPGITLRRFSFFPGKPRWLLRSSKSKILTYAISSVNTIPDIDAMDISRVLRRAFSRWSAVIPLSFIEINDYNSADIKIGFFHGDHGDGEPFDGVLGVLAHAFSPEKGRLHFDAAEIWAVDFELQRSKMAVDLESVATHEIGHILGLGHSTHKAAVMYPSMKPMSKKLDLTIDDVEGVQYLYGSNPNFKLGSVMESDTSSSKQGFSSVYSRSKRFLIRIFLATLPLYII